MKRLYLIRSIATVEAVDCYESKTGVYVFGDVAGYRYFADCLCRAGRSKQCVDISEIPKGSTSMRAVITPAANRPRVLPRLKLLERIVFRTAHPEMELIIHGNKSAYQWFAALLRKMVRTTKDDLWDHIHLDDCVNGWIVKRSVSLNIRSPLRKWTNNALGPFAETVRTRGEHYLPPCVEHVTKESFPYELPHAGAMSALSLNDRHRP